MKLVSLFGLVAVCFAVLTSPLRAEEVVEWGQVPGWDIMIDTTVGNGCFAEAEFTNGSVVRIGFDVGSGNGYLLAYNDSWGGIEEGAEYPITFDLDGTIYNGTAVGIFLDGTPGADIAFDSPDFLVDLAQRNTLRLSNEAGEVMAIDLAGSAVALSETITCQEAQN